MARSGRGQDFRLRLVAVDGNKVAQEFNLVGREGERAFERLQRGISPVNDNLRRTNQRVEGFRTELRGAASSIAVLDGPLGGIASRFNALATVIGRVGVGGAALGLTLTGLFFAVRRFTASFGDAERSALRLEALIRGLGDASAVTAQQVREVALAVGRETLAGVGDAEQAAAFLAPRVSSIEELERIIRVSQDLAETFGTQLSQEARSLARAVEDPTRALETLRDRGVDLGAVLERQIENLAAAGRESAALDLILGELEARFGGAGVGAGGGLLGVFDALVVSLDRFLRLIQELRGESGFFDLLVLLLTPGAALARGGTFAIEQLNDALEALTDRDRLRVLREQIELTEEQLELAREGRVRGPEGELRPLVGPDQGVAVARFTSQLAGLRRELEELAPAGERVREATERLFGRMGFLEGREQRQAEERRFAIEEALEQATRQTRGSRVDRALATLEGGLGFDLDEGERNALRARLQSAFLERLAGEEERKAARDLAKQELKELEQQQKDIGRAIQRQEQEAEKFLEKVRPGEALQRELSSLESTLAFLRLRETLGDEEVAALRRRGLAGLENLPPLLEDVRDTAGDAAGNLADFFVQAASGAADATDALNLLASTLQDIARILLEEAFVRPFTENIAAGIGSFARGGSGSGGGSGGFDELVRRFDIRAGQHGLDFTVRGSGGVDSQPVLLFLTPGERVMVRRPDQMLGNQPLPLFAMQGGGDIQAGGGGGGGIGRPVSVQGTFNINAPGADDATVAGLRSVASEIVDRSVALSMEAFLQRSGRDIRFLGRGR